ncbi:sodium/proline symporter PutP [Nesterenkonia aerolata]|uniref:Sodium/proline symporter n=1 Tax=Nesterenkonia aerolata TaxID=3074079 RepID=A0ABU2DPY1_9MICC|nr:sodium/proline symporter PutP [Nesterenkonia sp. LY-0111]MDR8018562.1 sodium/proline symporter PutP [Nesterenkonia sp. LY-0111]
MTTYADPTVQLIAVCLYFAAMLAIGYYAYRRTNDTEDYMLAGRQLTPTTAALSAGASDMSGWLMMGLPGAIYASGLIEAWIAIGLTVGAWLNWKFVAPRLRAYTEVANNSITIPSFFEARFKTTNHALRLTAGVVILGFFTFYVSSGLVAGGEFFRLAFGLDYTSGMLIVAGVTVLYTLIGGFLGASLTDVVQGTMMFLGLLIVPIIAVTVVGGFEEMTTQISTLDAAEGIDRLNILTGGTALGVISAAAWGLGYFGQPHIIVRFMALRTAADAKAARRIGIGWMGISCLGAVFTGLVAIPYFADDGGLENPEHAFLALSQAMFPSFIAALLLSAVLAAIMSTVSSQLVVSSSALVEDIFRVFRSSRNRRQELVLGRAAVLVVSLVAGLLALDNESTILELVGFAWAGFGASFGPIVLLSLYWRGLTMPGAISGLVTGAVTVAVWGNIDSLAGELYEIVPGFALNLLVAFVVSKATYRPNPEIDAEFDQMKAQAHSMITDAR